MMLSRKQSCPHHVQCRPTCMSPRNWLFTHSDSPLYCVLPTTKKFSWCVCFKHRCCWISKCCQITTLRRLLVVYPQLNQTFVTQIQHRYNPTSTQVSPSGFREVPTPLNHLGNHLSVMDQIEMFSMVFVSFEMHEVTHHNCNAAYVMNQICHIHAGAPWLRLLCP